MSCAKALWRDEESVFEELGEGYQVWSPETQERAVLGAGLEVGR